MTPAEIREGIDSRWEYWRQGILPSRKYALIVTGYCRRQFEHEWGDRRRALLSAAEQIAGRGRSSTQTVELQAFAQRLLDQANQSIINEHNSLEHGHAIPNWETHIPSPEEAQAIRLLALTFDQPEQAAAELVGSHLADSGCLLEVLECLRPLQWESHSAWFDLEMPTDARKWARRIYDTQEFSSLPILADLLEDSGCPNRPLLDHCRCSCWHGRGCAAVDRICGHPT